MTEKERLAGRMLRCFALMVLILAGLAPLGVWAQATTVTGDDGYIIEFDNDTDGSGDFQITDQGSALVVIEASEALFQTSLTVTGATSLQNVSSTNLSAGGALDIGGNTTLGGTLGVAGASTFGGAVVVTGGSSLQQVSLTAMDASGDVNVLGGLAVGGQTNLQYTSVTTLSASGNVGVAGDTVLNGALAVSGQGSFGNLSATAVDTGGLLVTGGSSLQNVSTTALESSGNATVGGALTVNGGTTLAAVTATSLNVVGAVGAGSISATTLETANLVVTSQTTLQTDLTVSGKTNVQGISATGNATIGGGLTAATLESLGVGMFGGNLYISGTVFAANVSTTGNQTTVGNNTITGSLEVQDGVTAQNGFVANAGTNSGNRLAVTAVGVSATVGNNLLVIDDATDTLTLQADSDASAANGRSRLVMTPTEASVQVTNAAGNTHGLNVTGAQTTLSGGTNSTVLTLDDSGAAFSNGSGGPARVMGVANGVNPFDAVNVQQLQRVRDQLAGGIANLAAMANLPTLLDGRNFGLSMGSGMYDGAMGLAVGTSARFAPNGVMRFSISGANTGPLTLGAGAGYSW